METCLGPLTAPVTTLDNRLGRRPRHLDSVDTKKKKIPGRYPRGQKISPQVFLKPLLFIHRMET